jgi:hypothetical protein
MGVGPGEGPYSVRRSGPLGPVWRWVNLTPGCQRLSTPNLLSSRENPRGDRRGPDSVMVRIRGRGAGSRGVTRGPVHEGAVVGRGPGKRVPRGYRFDGETHGRTPRLPVRRTPRPVHPCTHAALSDRVRCTCVPRSGEPEYRGQVRLRPGVRATGGARSGQSMRAALRRKREAPTPGSRRSGPHASGRPTVAVSKGPTVARARSPLTHAMAANTVQASSNVLSY